MTTPIGLFVHNCYVHVHTIRKHAYKHTDIYIYIYIYIYIHTCVCVCGSFNKFPEFFVQAFKIIVDSWKFRMLLLYIWWDDWPMLMISGSNEQLQQQLGIQPTKAWLSQLVNFKMHSGREDTLEKRYAIQFCFKHGKMPQKRMECFRLLFNHLAWIEHQF